MALFYIPTYIQRITQFCLNERVGNLNKVYTHTGPIVSQEELARQGSGRPAVLGFSSLKYPGPVL